MLSNSQGAGALCDIQAHTLLLYPGPVQVPDHPRPLLPHRRRVSPSSRIPRRPLTFPHHPNPPQHSQPRASDFHPVPLSPNPHGRLPSSRSQRPRNPGRTLDVRHNMGLPLRHPPQRTLRLLGHLVAPNFPRRLHGTDELPHSQRLAAQQRHRITTRRYHHRLHHLRRHARRRQLRASPPHTSRTPSRLLPVAARGSGGADFVLRGAAALDRAAADVGEEDGEWGFWVYVAVCDGAAVHE